MRQSFSIVLASLLVVALVEQEARAEESEADLLFHQGVRALRAGRNEDAIRFFQLSHDRQSRPAPLCNMGLAYERSGRYREAAESYRRCAAEDREGRFQRHANERASEMDRLIAAQRPPAMPTPAPAPRPPGAPPPAYGATPPQQQSPPPSTGRSSHVLGWLSLGVGVLSLASLGTAIGLNVWTYKLYYELDDRYKDQDRRIPEGSADADRVEQGRAGVAAAIALYATGGVLAAVAAVMLVLDMTGIGGDRWEYYPLASVMPTRGGLSLAISFALR